MAVPVDEGLPSDRRQRKVGGALLEEFAQQDNLSREGLGALVSWEQIGELVAEHGGAAGLEYDDRSPCFDFGEQFIHDVEQQALGAVEHANVVERASAAEMSAGDGDVEAGGLQHFDRGLGRVG